MRRHRQGLCRRCHRPVASGGNQHKEETCPPVKKTAAEVEALTARIRAAAGGCDRRRNLQGVVETETGFRASVYSRLGVVIAVAVPTSRSRTPFRRSGFLFCGRRQ